MPRSFACVEMLSKQMETPDTVIFFLGPAGTGKTTTMKHLYTSMLESGNYQKLLYVDAKCDNDFRDMSLYSFAF